MTNLQNYNLRRINRKQDAIISINQMADRHAIQTIFRCERASFRHCGQRFNFVAQPSKKSSRRAGIIARNVPVNFAQVRLGQWGYNDLKAHPG